MIMYKEFYQAVSLQFKLKADNGESGRIVIASKTNIFSL